MLISEKDTAGTVELAGFTKIYGNGKKQVKACSNIDFEAESSSVTGLLGLNGAGKSTMLKALCGVHYATEGKISVFGNEDPTYIRNVTGFVPEFPELDFSFTVAETLLLEQDLHCVPKELRKKYFDDAVRAMELKDVLNKKVSALSKGYLQRTSFAKALSYNPQVLILDEFSGGLDPAQISQLRKTIKKLSKSKTIILSTHHIEEAEALCDKIYVINKGSVAAFGSVESIIRKTGKKNLEEAFLSLTSSNEFDSDGEE